MGVYYCTPYNSVCACLFSVVTVFVLGKDRSGRTLLSCLILDAVWRWLELTGSNQLEKNLHPPPSMLCTDVIMCRSKTDEREKETRKKKKRWVRKELKNRDRERWVYNFYTRVVCVRCTAVRCSRFDYYRDSWRENGRHGWKIGIWGLPARQIVNLFPSRLLLSLSLSLTL